MWLLMKASGAAESGAIDAPRRPRSCHPRQSLKLGFGAARRFMVPCRRGIIVDAIAIGGLAGYFLAEVPAAASNQHLRSRTVMQGCSIISDAVGGASGIY